MSIRRIEGSQTSSAFNPSVKSQTLRGRKVEQWSETANPETAKTCAISTEILQQIFSRLPSGRLEKGKPYTVSVGGKTYTVIPMQSGLTKEELLQNLKDKKIKFVSPKNSNDKTAELRSESSWQKFRGDLQRYSPNGFIASV